MTGQQLSGTRSPVFFGGGEGGEWISPYSLPECWLFRVLLFRILRQRRDTQRRRRFPDRALEAMLSTDLDEPSLREIVKNKIGLGLKRPGMG